MSDLVSNQEEQESRSTGIIQGVMSPKLCRLARNLLAELIIFIWDVDDKE